MYLGLSVSRNGPFIGRVLTHHNPTQKGKMRIQRHSKRSFGHSCPTMVLEALAIGGWGRSAARQWPGGQTAPHNVPVYTVHL